MGHRDPGAGRRAIDQARCLVLTFINTVAFGRRCIPPRGVARRSNTRGILPPRALRGGRLAALGASPYLWKAALSGSSGNRMPAEVRRRLVSTSCCEHDRIVVRLADD